MSPWWCSYRMTVLFRMVLIYVYVVVGLIWESSSLPTTTFIGTRKLALMFGSVDIKESSVGCSFVGITARCFSCHRRIVLRCSCLFSDDGHVLTRRAQYLYRPHRRLCTAPVDSKTVEMIRGVWSWCPGWKLHWWSWPFFSSLAVTDIRLIHLVTFSLTISTAALLSRYH